MSKLQKVSSEIMPATAFADKVKQQIGDDSSIVPTSETSAPVRIITDETTCVDGLNLLQHNCPGAVENAAGGRTLCKCSCMSCLNAERLELAKANGDTQPERGIWVRGNGASVFTNSMTCVTCGSTRGEYGIRDHRSCAVVDTSTGSPIVCKCDCKDCKRLWFSDGRPVPRVENGKRIILRENGSKQTFTTEIKVADPVEFVGDTAGEIELRTAAMSQEEISATALVESEAMDAAISAVELDKLCLSPAFISGKAVRCRRVLGHEGQHMCGPSESLSWG